jgi:cytoskeletal protein RodZ
MSGGDDSVHTGSKIGRTLELARKERDLSLKQVEEATKIRAAYLAELERENFGVLPAVYVQGSLKTYANFLQLDGEEMVRELKRQQAPREEPSYPLYVGPREGDSLDDILVAIGGAGGVEPQDEVEDEAKDEADARPALLPRRIAGYLYLGSAVVLVVVAAAALALTVVGDGRPVVSQVREPLISQEPKTSPPNITQEDARTQQPSQGDEQRADDEGGKDEEADRRSQAEQAQGDSSQTQVSASATASASAAAEAIPATLQPSAASSLEATEEPDERSPIGVGASDSAPQSGTAPASSSRVAAQPTRRPPAAPSGGSRNPPAQDARGLEVRVRIGAEDPVRLSGGPFDD